jgi:predicted lipoprotein with Yx(FWY)xxD motif
MKLLVLALTFFISSYSFAGVLPLKAQQSLEDLDMDLVLTDAQGMSLYIFTPDTDDVSNCSGPCLKAWPAAILNSVEIEKVKASKIFGVITRADGQQQLTLDHKPLYYYVGDEKAGDRTGQGIGGVWFLLKSQFTIKEDAVKEEIAKE